MLSFCLSFSIVITSVVALCVGLISKKEGIDPIETSFISWILTVVVTLVACMAIGRIYALNEKREIEFLVKEGRFKALLFEPIENSVNKVAEIELDSGDILKLYKTDLGTVLYKEVEKGE